MPCLDALLTTVAEATTGGQRVGRNRSGGLGIQLDPLLCLLRLFISTSVLNASSSMVTDSLAWLGLWILLGVRGWFL